MSTQKSIADKLGVSISLVSRVLSGKAMEIGVASETIEKVLAEAERINYTPNSAALTLKGVKTHTLGVVTYDFEDPYFGIILGELHKIARERKFSLILAGSYQRDTSSLDISNFAKHNIEGLIIVGSDRKKDWYEKFNKKTIPIVQIGFTSDKKGANICLDEVASTALVAGYLESTETKTAALFFNDSLTHEIFKQAYVSSLKKHAIKIVSEFVCDGSDESVQIEIKKLQNLPDIIIAGDDIMAIKIIRSCHDAGISVPGDVKVIGFDDISHAHNFIPSLTTLKPPIREMVQMAFDLASDHTISAETLKFTPELVGRESG